MIKAGNSISMGLKQLSLNLGFLLLLLLQNLSAQPPLFKTYLYIEAHSALAIHQMSQYKIPASVILAQAIYESSSGTSVLARRSNNHFGIKCHVGWGGDTIVRTDDTLNECFRKYTNIEESYTDHSVFLSSRPRYANLFNLNVTDYKGWCIGLKGAGYATSPWYAEKLIKLIEDTKLYLLDGCENLTPVTLELKEPELRYSKYTGKGFSIKDFSRSGLIWLDPTDVLLRSLDFVVEHDQVAEN
jgi:hypothetical protein